MKVLFILDEVIVIICFLSDKCDVKNNLIVKYEFIEFQVEVIVLLQLYCLINIDIIVLKEEVEEFGKKIEEFEFILSNDKKLLKVIINSLKVLKKKYVDKRCFVIEEKIEEIKINFEVMVVFEDVYVIVMKDGYLKWMSQCLFVVFNGQDFGMKDMDRMFYQFEMNMMDVLLFFMNKGSYIYCLVYQLFDIRWKDMGQYLLNIIIIDCDEMIVKVILIKEFDLLVYLLFFMKNGMVKKIEFIYYKVQCYFKVFVVLNLKGEDELIDVYVINGESQIFMVIYLGYGLWFGEDEVNVVGVCVVGVKGINLKEDDFVVFGEIF